MYQISQTFKAIFEKLKYLDFGNEFYLHFSAPEIDMFMRFVNALLSTQIVWQAYSCMI